MQQPVTPPASSRERPLSVTILAIVAAVGGVGALLGVLAGATVVHGLWSLDAIEVIIVAVALVMSALYLAFAYGAWTLKRWGWTLGIVAGAASVVYMTTLLIRGWADLVVDAPPLALIGVLVVAIAAVGLFVWFRPGVRAAFARA